MKLRIPLAASLVFSASMLMAAATTVAVSPRPAAADADGVSSFIFEALEVELAGRDGMELVDRKRLSDLLAEQSLGAANMTGEQAAKVGKLVGANYYVFGETSAAGDRTAIKCRVVQVETGVFQPVLLVTAKDGDPMAAGADLAKRVGQAIDKLEGRAKTEDEASKAETALEIPEGTKLPVIAFRIPEVSVTPQGRTADPAAEKSLEGYFQKNGCKLVQLSRPGQSAAAADILAGTTAIGQHLEGAEHEALIAEAKTKGVDVLILGVAASERATQVGNFSAARARVEFAAVRVRDSHILATTSGYGVASDISTFVAEKKAIEAATGKLRKDFAARIIAAFNIASTPNRPEASPDTSGPKADS